MRMRLWDVQDARLNEVVVGVIFIARLTGAPDEKRCLWFIIYVFRRKRTAKKQTRSVGKVIRPLTLLILSIT